MPCCSLSCPRPMLPPCPATAVCAYTSPALFHYLYPFIPLPPSPPASLCICPPHNVTRPKSSSSCLCSTPHHAALPSESLLQNVKNVRGHLSMFHIHSLNLYSCNYNSPHSSHLSTMFKMVLLFFGTIIHCFVCYLVFFSIFTSDF